jgi:phosphoribosylaminoimidazolecarboxamide formyltransferase / IMP cyclohydrolase
VKERRLRDAYRTLVEEHFPPGLEIALVDDHGRQVLAYEKVTWMVDGERKGLRYGENPGQPAALYRLVNGNLTLGEVTSLLPGRWLASDAELLQSGKHPGKLNITDVDSGLAILRFFETTPCTVIIKHNNPCGVARAGTLAESYNRAYLADRVAAFGGAIVVNREIDLATAEMIASSYAEVVAAPEFAPGVLDLFARWKNLRVMRIGNLARLGQYVGQRVLDFRALVDGGLVLQWSYSPAVIDTVDFLPAEARHEGRDHKVNRAPTPAELQDLLFGWLIESGVTSNSVIYVKDGVTVGIGTGEQDRVGVAEIARDKAYRKMADRLAWERHAVGYAELSDAQAKQAIDHDVRVAHGGLAGAAMISDGFFPFRDGIQVGLAEGVTAIAQPGGSLRDWDCIDACNEAGVAMVFTGERAFRH